MRRVLPGYVLSALGDGMTVVAVSWCAIRLAPVTDQEVWVAAAVAAYTLPAAAGALLLGRFLRGRSPARLVGWDATLRACALGAIPIADVFGVLDIGLYVALLAASSVLHSWGQAGIFTLLARLLPEKDRLAGNAVLSVVGAGTTIAGPVVAAPLASFAVVGLLWPPYSSLSTTLVQSSAPPAGLPSVLAASSSVRVLSVPLGSAMAGPLVAGLGAAGALRFTATTVLMLGLTAALVASAPTWTGRRRRSVERGPGRRR